MILAKADFELTAKEMSQVFSTIDDDNSGHISYKEFATELRNSDPARQAAILKGKSPQNSRREARNSATAEGRGAGKSEKSAEQRRTA